MYLQLIIAYYILIILSYLSRWTKAIRTHLSQKRRIMKR
jgi:hypothetical protein